MAWSGYEKRVVYGGTTQVSCIIDPIDGSGVPKTGITAGSITAWYVMPGASPVEIPVSALASSQADHTPGGWFELDSVNVPGAYRFDLPDEAFVRGTRLVHVYFFGGSTEWPIILFDFFDQWLPADLGETRGPWNSVKEAMQAIRAHTIGTRRFTRESGVEEILMPDRATVLSTRAAEPSGGPVSRLIERGDQTVRMSAPIGVVAEGQNPTMGHLVIAPAIEVVAEGQTPTLPVQGPVADVVAEVQGPTLPVQATVVQTVAEVPAPTTS